MVWLRCAVLLIIFCCGNVAAMNRASRAAKRAVRTQKAVQQQTAVLTFEEAKEQFCYELIRLKALFVLAIHLLSKINFKAQETPFLLWDGDDNDNVRGRYNLVFNDPMGKLAAKHDATLDTDTAMSLLSASLMAVDETLLHCRQSVRSMAGLRRAVGIFSGALVANLFNLHQMLSKVTWLTPAEDAALALPCCDCAVDILTDPRKKCEMLQAHQVLDSAPEQYWSSCGCGKTLLDVLGDDGSNFTDAREAQVIARLADQRLIPIYFKRIKLMLNRLVCMRIFSGSLRQFAEKKGVTLEKKLLKLLSDATCEVMTFMPNHMLRLLGQCVKVLLGPKPPRELVAVPVTPVIDNVLHQIMEFVDLPVFVGKG